MKTRLFLSSAFALLAGTVSAQYRSELSEHLTRDEVPAAVQQSLENKFGHPGVGGQWELFYIEATIENSHDTILTPEFYGYSCNMNGERMEYLFKPDGSLYQTKSRALRGGGKLE